MIRKAVLEAAVGRGFLVECKEGNSGVQYGLGPLGLKVRRNILNEWTRTVQLNQLCFRCESDAVDDFAAISKAIKEHINKCHQPPFCLSFDRQWKEKDGQSDFLFSDDGIFKNVSKYHFYSICHAISSRLSFDLLLRRRQNWWTEMTGHDSKFDFVAAPTNTDETLVRMLPFPNFGSQSQAKESVRQDEMMCLDILEEKPEIEVESKSGHFNISAIRNTLSVEPAILALLEGGVSNMENGALGFRLHKHLTPYPIAMIHHVTKNDKFSASDVEQLVSVMTSIMDHLGLKQHVQTIRVHDERPEEQWKKLKASGVLYGFVIDANVLETGVIRFWHHDLDSQVETALPQVRTELLQRLGKIQRRFDTDST